MTQMTVITEGDSIVLVLDGKRVCDMPVQVAKELIRVLDDKVKRIEELQNAEKIILDQAILQRAGSFVGLSNHPKIQDEARKEAQWNSMLRKSMPLKGIEPRSVVGTPALRKN